MIYVFGDSHARKFEDVYEVRWQRGLTCHGFCLGNIGEQPKRLSDLPKLSEKGRAIYLEMIKEVGHDDAILFVLGECDCRLQFYHHHKRDGMPITALIDDTVGRYIAFLEMVEVGKAVLDVIPAVNQRNVYEFPHYATLEKRAEITVMFNETLELACREANVPFIDTWKALADENGGLRSEFMGPDRFHVADAIVPYIEAQLRKHFPEKIRIK